MKNEQLFSAICKGDREIVRKEVQKAIDEQKDLVEVLNHSMIPAMREMGRRFSEGEIFVPDMLISARAMQTGLDLVEPMLVESGHKGAGTVCIGTVKGDLHDIGKNLVTMMLKGAGYQVIDLGVDCDVAQFESAVSDGAQAVLLSALLTTTMPYMEQVVQHFSERPDVSIIIGGAPVTQEYADKIGAQGYGMDANAAVEVVERCLST